MGYRALKGQAATPARPVVSASLMLAYWSAETRVEEAKVAARLQHRDLRERRPMTTAIDCFSAVFPSSRVS